MIRARTPRSTAASWPPTRPWRACSSTWMKWLPNNEHRSPVRDAPPLLQPVEHRYRHRRAGVATLRGCDGLRRPTRAASLPAESEARHLPVPAWRALAARSVRLQAEPGEAARHGAARLGSQGTASHRDDVVPDDVPHGSVDLPFRSLRSIGRRAQRTAALHPKDRRRHLRHPVAPNRRHQSRSGGDFFPDRVPTGGATQHRRVDLLWAGQ